MKCQNRAWLWALLLSAGALGSDVARAETFRCRQADGSVAFQQAPCSLAELVAPDPAPPAVKQPVQAPAAPAAAAASAPLVAAPARPVVRERLVTVPAAAAVVPTGTPSDEPFVKPSKRKRDILELSAQFNRCRYDAPGFAQKSDAVYAAWIRRHGAVLAEYDKLLAAKVRASRRGEATLPLSICTDDWLRTTLEPLSRTPDPRLQTVEKTWQAFLGALMTGDRAAALSCLGGRAETRWKAKVEQLSDEDLRRVAASVRALKVQWGDDYEKEGMVADTDNRVVAIAFRNVNDEWKIMELGGAPAVSLPIEPPPPATQAAQPPQPKAE